MFGKPKQGNQPGTGTTTAAQPTNPNKPPQPSFNDLWNDSNKPKL